MKPILSMPRNSAEIPQAVKDAYNISQGVDLIYSDSQCPAQIQAERERQRDIDRQAEREFYRVCEASGYHYDIYTSIEFDRMIQDWYYYEQFNTKKP